MVLSIIVPIYGVEKYIEKCVKSLIDTKILEKYEIILVDDGSKDHSGTIIDEYEKQFSNIKAYHKSNGGLSDARNFGLERAIGDYVMFVDGDDYIDNAKIPSIIALLSKKTDDILCFGAYQLINGNHVEKKDVKIGGSVSGVDYFKVQYINNNFKIAVWNYIFRRDFLMQNKLYFKKGILHEDNEWTPRAFFAAQTVSNYAITFYNYNIREDSICTQKSKKKNITDMGNTLLSLVNQYKDFPDNTAYRLLKDYLTSSYMHLYVLAKNNRDNPKPLKLIFLIKDLYFFKTKLKVLIFKLAPQLYK